MGVNAASPPGASTATQCYGGGGTLMQRGSCEFFCRKSWKADAFPLTSMLLKMYS